jgi:hypothetical protein
MRSPFSVLLSLHVYSVANNFNYLWDMAISAADISVLSGASITPSSSGVSLSLNALNTITIANAGSMKSFSTVNMSAGSSISLSTASGNIGNSTAALNLQAPNITLMNSGTGGIYATVGSGSRSTALNLGISTNNYSSVAINSLSSVSTNTVASSSTVAGQQIMDVVFGDWASWTGSANGTLTVAQVGNLVSNPNITGSQAVVLGMIADQMNADILDNPNQTPAYSLASVVQRVFGTSANSSGTFGNFSTAQQYYMQGQAQVASATNSNGTFNLYGSYNGPQLSSTQQGQIGDCFFIASVDGILNENPQLISKMITQNSNGTFTVAFADGQTENVTVTDGEIASGNIATNNGCWLTVMDLAGDKALQHFVPITFNTTQLINALLTPTGIIAQGGDPAVALTMLSTQRYGDYLIGQSSSYFNQNFSAILNASFPTYGINTPMGLATENHELEIIGFNSSTQTVTIMNPWGTSGAFGYAQDPGGFTANVEFQMVNDVFSASTTQVLQDFYGIVMPLTNIQSSIAAGKNLIASPGISLHLTSSELTSIGAFHNMPISLASVQQDSLHAACQTLSIKIPAVATVLPATFNVTTLTGQTHTSFSLPQTNTDTKILTSQAGSNADENTIVTDTSDYFVDEQNNELSAGF